MNDETFIVWRCRECGKRSYAKRDPIAHHRWVETIDDDGFAVGRHAVWCGPFDRFIATPDHSKPPREALPHLGEPVGGRSYEFEDDPNAGIEAPF